MEIDVNNLTTEQLIAWFVDVQRRHTGTGSATAMREAIKAVFFGIRGVDSNVRRVFLQLLADPVAAEYVGNMLYNHNPEPLCDPADSLIGKAHPTEGGTYVACGWIPNDLT